MPVVTRYPTTDTAVSGTWANPTNVQAADGAVAQTTLAVESTTVEREQGGYGFDGVIPAEVQINSVTIEVRHRVSTSSGVALLDNLGRVNGVAGAINTDALEPTALTVRSYPYARPGGGPWTRADLLDGTFSTRVRARTGPNVLDFRVTEVDDQRVTEVDDARITEESGGSGVSVDFAWDYIRVVVDYTVVDTSVYVVLKQGSTVITSKVLNLGSLTTDFTFALTPGELALITDPDDLTLTITSAMLGQRVFEARLVLTGPPTIIVDTTPPQVFSFSPANGSTNVARNANLVVTFTEPVKAGTGTLVLRTSAGLTVQIFDVSTSPQVSISGQVLTVNPSVDLDYNTQYYFDIPYGSVLDLADNAYAGTTTYTFTSVPDLLGPVVVAFDPVVGATNVPLNANISITFDELIERGTGNIVIRTAGGATVETFDVATSTRITIVGNVLTIDPTPPLGYNFTYFVDIPSGAIRDLSGNPYLGTDTYSFSTSNLTIAVTNYSPGFGEVGVGLGTNIEFTFNTVVQRGLGIISLYMAPGVLVETFNVASSNRISFSGNVVTIDPTEPLQYGRIYTLTIPSGAILDLAGVAYAGTTSYNFTTLTLPGVGDWMPGSIPKKGFWVSLATSAHSRGAVEVQLDPAPSKVDYPTAPLGDMIETADGRVVMQQPNRDPRRRSWVWTNFGPLVNTYERQFRWLEGLRSRYRQMTGQSPYIYVYDGTTNLLSKRNVLTTPLISRTNNVLTVADFTATVHPTVLTNATVDLFVNGETSASQRVSVSYATATTLVVYPDVQVSGSIVLKITYLEPHWWRARVLDTTRTPLEAGLMRYAESKFTFVIDDPNWTEVG